MDHVWEQNPSSSPPAVPNPVLTGYPSESGTPTTPGAYWFYQLTEELRNILVSLGVTPDITKVTQLATALLGIAENSATFSASLASANSGYSAGAMIATADGKGFWLNTSAGNINNPDTTAAASSGWVPLAQYGVTTIPGLTNANITLTAPQAAKPLITLSGALTSNVQIIFPPWTKQWMVSNKTTGAFVVTCITVAGTGVVVPQGGTSLVWGDGTNINSQAGSYVAGSFTGTSTDFTTPVTGTFQYTIVGNVATVAIPYAFAGTSNDNALVITGIPAVLFPYNPGLSQQSAPFGMNGLVDNGVQVTDVTCTVEPYGTGYALIFRHANGNGWSTTGTKGFSGALSTLTYSLL